MIRTVNLVHLFVRQGAEDGLKNARLCSVMTYMFLRNETCLLLHLTNPVVSVFCAVKLKYRWTCRCKNAESLRELQACILVSGMVFVLNILDFSKLTKDITCVLIFVRGFWFPKILFCCQKCSSFWLLSSCTWILKIIMLTVKDLENVNYRKGKSLFANATTWQKLFFLIFIYMANFWYLLLEMIAVGACLAWENF